MGIVFTFVVGFSRCEKVMCEQHAFYHPPSLSGISNSEVSPRSSPFNLGGHKDVLISYVIHELPMGRQ